MKVIATILLPCAILVGCNEGPRSEAPPADEPRAVPRDELPAAPAEKKRGTSVMRPSVAAKVQPPQPPPPEPAKLTVQFGSGAMKLDEEARSALDGLLGAPAIQAGGRIVVRGHSDSRGHDGDNLVSSARRAAAVIDYLAEKGIDRERMTSIALGEGRPVAPNVNLDGSDNPEGRAQNRRVEVEVLLPKAQAAAEPQQEPPPTE